MIREAHVCYRTVQPLHLFTVESRKDQPVVNAWFRGMAGQGEGKTRRNNTEVQPGHRSNEIEVSNLTCTS